MKLPDEISVWTRETLVGLEGESTTVAFFSGGDMSSIPPRTEGMWQFAVDMIYRFVVCELVEPELFVEGHDNNWFLATIRTISPYVRNGGFFWNGTFVKATDKLRDMTERHFPESYQVDVLSNPSFIDEVEEMFIRYNVPWSETPLLPLIKDAEASAP